MPSDDIVERLRSTGGLDARLLCAAADEIERLRLDYSAAEQDHVDCAAAYAHAKIEIERLRAELRTYTGDGHTLGEHLAREAL